MKIARLSTTSEKVSPFGENALGEERRFAVRGKHAGSSNGISPFKENAPGQTTAFCRSGKPRWARNGVSPFEENAPGRATAFRRSGKTRRDEQRRFAVQRNCAETSQKFLFAPCFQQNKKTSEKLGSRAKSLRYISDANFKRSLKIKSAGNFNFIQL